MLSIRPIRALLTVGLPLVLIAGCGNSRTPVPSLSTPATPAGFRRLTYPRSSVALDVPRNWTVSPERRPLLNVISSGAATVAVWSYARSAPPPSGAAALQSARGRLIAAARARDGGLQLIRSKVVSVGGASGIELDAFERISGQLRRVRSTHVFLHGAELVLDEYAPPALFHAVDHSVFSPLKRSLRLLPPA